jgi:signal transduction histidine kinase
LLKQRKSRFSCDNGFFRMPAWVKKYLPVSGILATLVLFLAIAALQARWIAQLGETDLRLRKITLTESLRAARNDINRELTGAYALFQLEDSPPRESWAALTAERYAIWKHRAKFKDLVQRVFVLEPAHGVLELSAFNTETKKFDPVDWPSELNDLKDRLQPPFPGLVAFGVHTFTGVVSPPAPVLIFPIAFDPNRRFAGLSRWLIVQLNQRALLTNVIPAILRAHVEQAQEFDFQVTTVDGVLVFKSDPKATFSSVDASVTVLELANDYFPHGIGAAVPRRQMLFRDTVNKPGQLPDALGEGGVWRLQVRHRLGSLAAAATRMRRGNVALSFTMIALVILDLVVLALLVRRMHRVAESKAEFAAAVSHELRTPVAAICSAADNLAAGVAIEPLRVQQYGAAILDHGKQLAGMVEQILSFASGEAARRQTESEPLDAAEVIKQSIGAVSPAARAAGIEIEPQIAGDLPDILGDSAAIQQALINLLTNAIKYAKAGGWVRVSASKNESGDLEITVADRGPGIPPSELKHIFEPFYRGFTASTLQVHGTGLGLTIVERTARAHGGRVTVDSTPGRGSKFTIHLPTL